MSLLYFIVLSVLYILVQSQSVDVQTESLQYKVLFTLKNHSNYLDDVFKNKGKINFQDYLFKDPSFQNVMNIENVLKDSDIFYLCDKNIPDLNNSVALSHVKKYPGMLLCMGLAHVLMLNGMVFTQQPIINQKLTLPESKSDLDAIITNMNDNDTLKHELMCEQHKVTLPRYHSDVVQYVQLLNPLLDDVNMCKTVCLDFSDSINPICAFIMEANAVFYNNIRQSNTNLTSPPENVDSVKAMEQNSGIDKTVSNTKEITDDPKEEEVPVNKGNIAIVLNNSNNKSDSLNNTTNNNNTESVIQSKHVETVVTDKQNNTSTTTTIALIPAVDVNESGENTNDDDAGDYAIQTGKEPKKPDTTITKANPPTEDKIPPEPTDKIISDFEDDDAAKEAEGDTLEIKKLKVSKLEDKPASDPKPREETSKIKKVKSSPPKTSANTVTVTKTKEDSVIEDDMNEPLPPPIEDPPAPNGDTLEGDNILINANNNGAVNNDDEEFSSNIDQKNYKQQGEDPGDPQLEIQENTPYIIPKDGFVEAEDSHFFSYFVLMFVVCIVMYLVFYNKRKLLALALEGRHTGGRRTRSRRGTYSRVNTGHDESKEHLLY